MDSRLPGPDHFADPCGVLQVAVEDQAGDHRVGKATGYEIRVDHSVAEFSVGVGADPEARIPPVQVALHVSKGWANHPVVSNNGFPGPGLVVRIKDAPESAGRREADRRELVDEATGTVAILAIAFVHVGCVIPKVLPPAELLVFGCGSLRLLLALFGEINVSHQRRHGGRRSQGRHQIRTNKGVGALHGGIVGVLLVDEYHARLCIQVLGEDVFHLGLNVGPDGFEKVQSGIRLLDH
mmetsp:Transcript_23041/g.50278  ORF Transcript_23041/g.50278 Transcript_23041/m.50278 type:complete len:238 (+) Transcript_23041:165-878(+)